MEVKDWIAIATALGALIGVVGSFVTARGAYYSYKAKIAEMKGSHISPPAPVRIISLRDRPPTNIFLLMWIGMAIGMAMFFSLALVFFWQELNIWQIGIFLSVGALSILMLYIFWDGLFTRSSRTKYGVTVTVLGAYDIVFFKCKDLGPVLS